MIHSFTRLVLVRRLIFLAKYSKCASGEMVDALVLGTSGVTRGGSSPLLRTLNVLFA